MDRRALLKHMAALGLAVPAMSVERTYFLGPWAPEQPPKLWGDAIHDDAVALRWYLDHRKQVPKGFYLASNLRVHNDSPLFSTSPSWIDGKHVYEFLGGVSSGVLVKMCSGEGHHSQEYTQEWIEDDAWWRVHQRAMFRLIPEQARGRVRSEKEVAAAVQRAERRLERQKEQERIVDTAEGRGSLDAEIEVEVAQERRDRAIFDRLHALSGTAPAVHVQVADRAVASWSELDTQRILELDAHGEVVGIGFVGTPDSGVNLSDLPNQAELARRLGELKIRVLV